MGEAKASGNLGNTLKVLGRFDEAIVCCQRHLDIAQEQGDKVGGGPRPVAPSGSGIGAAGDTTHSPMCSSRGTTVPFRNEGTLAHTDAVGLRPGLPSSMSAPLSPPSPLKPPTPPVTPGARGRRGWGPALEGTWLERQHRSSSGDSPALCPPAVALWDKHPCPCVDQETAAER